MLDHQWLRRTDLRPPWPASSCAAGVKGGEKFALATGATGPKARGARSAGSGTTGPKDRGARGAGRGKEKSGEKQMVTSNPLLSVIN